MNSNFHVLIPCAGTGARIGGEVPKQFQKLHQQAIVLYSLNVFLNMPEIKTVWVGLSESIFHNQELMQVFPKHPKLRLCVTGGKTRALTVLNTLDHLLSQNSDVVLADDWILVHDAARPGIQSKSVKELIDTVSKSNHAGGILALPLADTLKKASTDNGLTQSNSTVDRTGLWLAQTPQMFKINDLRESIYKSLEKSLDVTDEASAMENSGHSVLLVEGDFQNFKVTYPKDLKNMERLLSKSLLKIGQGYDVHQLVEGRPLILGGITVPYEKGLLGHSDADALLHAIIDALLGAAGLGDIGQHFPDTDPAYHGADSGVLLQHAYTKVVHSGYELVNLDATIICQKPKLMPYLDAMKERIANLMDVNSQQINLKAKTNEGLGYLGEQLAIETQTTVLIAKIS
jgi:2-C-methyl-D-erythritol 4-phosphate cytidylyltransferase/2-C-methyl-D-erythritol 2,4-cyclodiphosphate synthase